MFKDLNALYTFPASIRNPQAICIFFLDLLFVLVSPSILRLPSNTITTPYSLINSTHHLMKGWPSEYEDFHIKGGIYLEVGPYAKAINRSFEAEVLEALEMIGLDIDTEGDPEGMPSQKGYAWSWIHGLVHPRKADGSSSLNKKQVSSILDFLSRLTIMYGSRNLMGTAVLLRGGNGKVLVVWMLLLT